MIATSLYPWAGPKGLITFNGASTNMGTTVSKKYAPASDTMNSDDAASYSTPFVTRSERGA